MINLCMLHVVKVYSSLFLCVLHQFPTIFKFILFSLRIRPLLTYMTWSQPSLTQNPIPSLKSKISIPKVPTTKEASWLYCRAPPQSTAHTCTIITVISVRGRWSRPLPPHLPHPHQTHACTRTPTPQSTRVWLVVRTLHSTCIDAFFFHLSCM